MIRGVLLAGVLLPFPPPERTLSSLVGAFSVPCGERPRLLLEGRASGAACLETLEGDLVFDPFCGSNTTGVAARELSRFFAGAEFEEEFAETHRGCSLAINRATGRAFSTEPPPRAKAEANACRLW